MAAYLLTTSLYHSRESGISPHRLIIKRDSAMARTSTALIAALVGFAASHASLAQKGAGAQVMQCQAEDGLFAGPIMNRIYSSA
jgi:hypothetical protein